MEQHTFSLKIFCPNIRFGSRFFVPTYVLAQDYCFDTQFGSRIMEQHRFWLKISALMYILAQELWNNIGTFLLKIFCPNKRFGSKFFVPTYVLAQDFLSQHTFWLKIFCPNIRFDSRLLL